MRVEALNKDIDRLNSLIAQETAWLNKIDTSNTHLASPRSLSLNSGKQVKSKFVNSLDFLTVNSKSDYF